MNRILTHSFQQLLIFILFLFVGLTACSGNPTGVPPRTTPAQTRVDPQRMTPSEALASPSATANQQTTATIPAATPTSTPTASPQPSPSPTPAKISVENAARVQVIRYFPIMDSATDTVLVTQISPDTKWVAVGGFTKAGNDYKTFIRLTNIDSGETREMEYLSPVIEAMAFSPDEQVLAAAGCDLSLDLVGQVDTVCNQPHVWLVDTRSGKTIARYDDYKSNVTSLLFSPDGKYLYTGVRYSLQQNKPDNIIRVYDVASTKLVSKIKSNQTNCTDVGLDITPDGGTLIEGISANCGYPSMIAWFKIGNGGSGTLISSQPGRSHSFSSDSSSILLDQLDGSMLQFDLQTGQRSGFFGTGERWLLGFNYLAGRNSVFVNGLVGVPPKVYDVPSGKVTQTFDFGSDVFSGSSGLSRDLGTLVTFVSANQDLVTPAMVIWNTSTWQSARIANDAYHFLPSASAHWTFSSDQQRLAATDGRSIMVWGFPSTEQDPAKQTLIDYINLLEKGDFDQASKRFSDQNMQYMAPDYMPQHFPAVDPANRAALLQAICQDPAYPCFALKEILLQSQETANSFVFIVSFSLPEGVSLPACKKDPKFAWPAGVSKDQFDYTVQKDADGIYRVMGFPPAYTVRQDGLCP